jgi:hypothetical protein
MKGPLGPNEREFRIEVVLNEVNGRVELRAVIKAMRTGQIALQIRDDERVGVDGERDRNALLLPVQHERGTVLCHLVELASELFLVRRILPLRRDPHRVLGRRIEEAAPLRGVAVENGGHHSLGRQDQVHQTRAYLNRAVAPCSSSPSLARHVIRYMQGLGRGREGCDCFALLLCFARRSLPAPMPTPSVRDLTTVTSNVRSLIEGALADSGGLLRLAPCWVPRSFLQPGKRLKLHPDDLYAFGLNRGGIDERWFASTTPAANENRTPDEGLSYVVAGGRRCTLAAAVAECGAALIGNAIWNKYKKWPVYSKFFDNMGPIPHHMHQSAAQAKLVGQEGKPESYYFPPQHNNVGNNFPYTFMGLEPGTTKAQVRRCLENWNRGDNGILDLSRAYRLKPGTGWLIPPAVLHAPGSLCTYEPQWGSDVFGMYQSLVEGREVPWSLLVKDMPKEKHHDLDFIVDQLDWEENLDPNFKDNHYLEPVPVADTAAQGFVDRWIVYGKIKGEQLFTAKELTIDPGVKCTIKDTGAYGLITVQGKGRMNKLTLDCPKLIRFHDLTEDEVFCPESTARAGVTFENTSTVEPLVVLRYFGPEANPDAPAMGAYRKNG